MSELRFAKASTDSDVDRLLDVRKSYPIEDAQIPKVRQRYINEIAEADNRIVYLAWSNDQEVVAYAQLILKNADNDPELADGSAIAHVHDLRVRSDIQAHGIGKRFMSFLEMTSAQLGVQTLTLGVDNWNSRAIQLYKKLGYQEFKQTDGRTDDEKCIYMKKAIHLLK